MNYDEHVECLNVWFFFRCMITMYASLLQRILFQFLCMHLFMELVARLANGMVVSSSPFGGSGRYRLVSELKVAIVGLYGPRRSN